jgi:molybdopterin molybdotransferase
MGPGNAVRIMTGAPLPPGADSIVPVEQTTEADGFVSVEGPVANGAFIRRAGEDVRLGETVVSAGTELGPGELAMLASVGASPVEVVRMPEVTVLITGDELVPPEVEPGEGQIRDSNSVALKALLAEAGAGSVLIDRVPDDRDAVVDAVRRAAVDSDLIISSGGVAVGKYDFVKSVVEQLGRIDMWRVAMQPGKPVVLGEVAGTPFLGLPGNPVSIHVSFEQFVRPAIRKMRGCNALLRPTMSATLTADITKPPGRMHFVRVRLTRSGDAWAATPTGPQGSHIQSSLVQCHGLARFPLEDTRLSVGDPVTVELWKLPETQA